MTEFKEGDRVRVVLEGTYVRVNACSSHYHYVDLPGVGGAHLDDRKVTIEALPVAQREEPKGYGAVVEINGKRFSRLDPEDDMSWVDKFSDWYSWQELLELGPVTVLFDPDTHEVAVNPDASAEDPEIVVDRDGSNW